MVLASVLILLSGAGCQNNFKTVKKKSTQMLEDWISAA